MTRREETGLALNQSHPRTGRVACLAKDVAIRRVTPNLAFGNALPKRSQPLEPPLLRVAGDDCAIDGSDGDARDPIGLDVGLAYGLEHPRMVGTRRSHGQQ